MSGSSRFRFSLRSMLLFVAVVAVVCLWYRSHVAFQRSPKTGHTGGGYQPKATPQHFYTHYYRDHAGRLVAIFLLTIDDIDVNGPRYQLKYGYNAHEGGWLVLDGKPIEPGTRPRMFANNPHGRLVELEVTPQEAERLANCRGGAEFAAFYREVVEPKFFERQGMADAKGRQGVWTYRLPGGELYRQVTYVDGNRHGEMKVYYPSGALKFQADFLEGRPTGRWTIYAPDGRVLGILDHEHGKVADKTAPQVWRSQIDHERGYRLIVGSTELEIPQ